MNLEELFGTPDADALISHAPSGSPRGAGTFTSGVRRLDSRITLVEIAGPLDLSTRERFDAHLDEALDHHAGSVIVDLSGVTFLCAGAVESLLDTERRARELDKNLTLVTGAHPVDRPLRALGLKHRFTVADGPRAAAEPGEASEGVVSDVRAVTPARDVSAA